MSSNLSKLKAKWLKDKSVKESYDEQALEFSIARKLISERLKAHLTQKEMAEKMGTTQSVIARIESGAQLPSMKTIERYALALRGKSGPAPGVHKPGIVVTAGQKNVLERAVPDGAARPLVQPDKYLARDSRPGTRPPKGGR